MNNQISIRVRYEELRSLAFGGISGTYAAVGTPLAHPSRMFKITNLTDANLLITFDDTSKTFDVIAAGSAFIYDYCSDKSDRAGTFEQAKGTQVYVKQESSAATSGTVYVTTIYASNA